MRVILCNWSSSLLLNGTCSVIQARFLAAMLSEGNVTRAAEQAGVPARTAARWLAEGHEVRAEYVRASRGVLTAAETTVRAAAGAAVEVVVEIMRTGELESNRLRAALALLHAARGVDLASMEERIERSNRGQDEPGKSTEADRQAGSLRR